MRPHSRTLTATVLLGLLSHGPASSQSDPVMPASEARQTMLQLRAQAGQSRAKMDEMTARMITLDREIEDRVERVLVLLGGVRDSTDSGTKVARAKEQALEGLLRSVEAYAQERQKLRAELERPFRRLSKEDLEQSIEVFDDKIEKRVDQIIGLSSSLTQSAGYQKYRMTYSREHGYGRTVTDEYRQNRRVAAKSTRSKEQLVEALGESAGALEARNEQLRRDLARGATVADRERIEQEIATNEEKMTRRREQAASVVLGETPETVAVGSKEASALRRHLQREADAIKEAWDELMTLKRNVDTERSRVRWLKARYDATRKVLDEGGG